MSMVNKPPRTSALGAMWSEDFGRGIAGINKNGGTIAGTVSTDRNGWISMAGASQITYPAQRFGGLTEISFGSWVKDTSGAGYQTIVMSADWVTSGFVLHTPNDWVSINMRINISGTQRLVSIAFPGGRVHLVCTWKSGEGIRGYANGVEIGISAAYAGVVSQSVINSVMVGSSSGFQYLTGKIKDPFFVGRQLSAAEVLDLYNNRTFR